MSIDQTLGNPSLDLLDVHAKMFQLIQIYLQTIDICASNLHFNEDNKIIVC